MAYIIPFAEIARSFLFVRIFSIYPVINIWFIAGVIIPFNNKLIIEKFGVSLSSAPENKSFLANPVFKSSRSNVTTAKIGIIPTNNPRRIFQELGFDNPNCKEFSLPVKNKHVRVTIKKIRGQ